MFNSRTGFKTSFKFDRWHRLSVHIVIVIAGSSCLLFLLASSVLESEPSSGGKRLSGWLRQAREGTVTRPIVEENLREFKIAVKQIGTNAIPYLLKMASRQDSSFK